MDQSSAYLDTLVERLKNTNNVCVLTGAGVSKESGVPTFREADGLWKKFRPEELANVEAFINNPELVWEWYSWRRDLMSNVKPNAGHYALVDLEKYFKKFNLVTQNVDNLHIESGSENVIELHGNIQRNKCYDCGVTFEKDDLDATFTFRKGHLPRCPKCITGLLRPDVVWFGEMLPEAAINKAWVESENCEVFLSVGTSSVVYPAAALPQQAKASGAFLVEINPTPTELSSIADIAIQAPSGEILPEIVSRLR
jgi:NAD-dependent protein deacetylase/lipoamidase